MPVTPLKAHVFIVSKIAALAHGEFSPDMQDRLAIVVTTDGALIHTSTSTHDARNLIEEAIRYNNHTIEL